MKITTNATSNQGLAVEHFMHWEREYSQKIYMTQPFPDGRVIDYSWSEVGNLARRFANYLVSLKLPQGSHIALLGKNSAHWIMADLGIWMAGHVSVPIYPTANAETVSYILEHSDSKLLVLGKLDGISDCWLSICHDLPIGMPLVTLPMSPHASGLAWDHIVEQYAPLQHLRLASADALATVIYTSGNTGQPKGVMHSHGNIAIACKAMQDTFAMNQQDRMLSYLPLAHAAERAIVEVNSFYCGFRIYFCHTLETFVEDMRRARPTVFFSVPRLWTKFYLGISAKMHEQHLTRALQLPLVNKFLRRTILKKLGLQDTRIAVTGSAPLPPPIIAWYRLLGLEMLDGYGMTENFAVSHFSRPGQVRSGFVGSPVLGVQARISPIGEVEVRSPAQMLGYYKQPGQAEEETTIDGFYRTGDRGQIDSQGRLKITGRTKELFKTSKGKYIAPAPIEQRLGSHTALEAVCVIGAGQAQPFGLAVLSAEAHQIMDKLKNLKSLEKEFEALLDDTNRSLEDHEKLDYLVVTNEPWTVDRGFLTPTLKIRRSAIEDHYMPFAETWAKLQRRVIWLL